MLASAVKNFASYEPHLSEKTLQGLASLVLENMIPSEGFMQNLVLRDTGKITPEEFSRREMERIMGDQAYPGKSPRA